MSSTHPITSERRRGRFCWQDHDDLDALRAHFASDRVFKGATLSTALAVYLVMTEVANLHYRNGRDAFQARRKLMAEKAGVSTRTFDRYVTELEASGLIEIERRIVEGVQLPNLWHLTNAPSVMGVAGGDMDAHDPATPVSPPSDTDDAPTTEEAPTASPPVREEEREEARAGARDLALVAPPSDVPRRSSPDVRYKGNVVPPPVVDSARYLLRVFNEAASRDVGAERADGKPSPALTQVMGALLARPQVGADEWVRAIRNTVASPPSWLEGPVQIGTIFGERAAEHALSNDGQRHRKGDDPAKAARLDSMRQTMELARAGA